MANISSYLNAISEAILGEEVRTSIINAIAAINDDNESYQQIKADIHTDKEAIDSQVAIFSTLVMQATTLQNSINSAFTSANIAKTDLITATGNANTINSTLLATITTATTKKTELDALVEECEDLNTSLYGMTITANNARNSLGTSTSSALGAKGDLQTAITQSVTAKSNLDGSINTSVSRKSQLEGVITSSNTAISNLTASISTATQRINSLTSLNTAADAKIAQLNGLTSDFETINKKAQDRRDVADATLSYPAISYLELYYYDKSDVDDLLDEREAAIYTQVAQMIADANSNNS